MWKSSGCWTVVSIHISSTGTRSWKTLDIQPYHKSHMCACETLYHFLFACFFFICALRLMWQFKLWHRKWWINKRMCQNARRGTGVQNDKWKLNRIGIRRSGTLTYRRSHFTVNIIARNFRMITEYGRSPSPTEIADDTCKSFAYEAKRLCSKCWRNKWEFLHFLFFSGWMNGPSQNDSHAQILKCYTL